MLCIVPQSLTHEVHKGCTLRGTRIEGRMHQQVSVSIDGAPLPRLADWQAGEEILRHHLEALLFPTVEMGHQVTRETGDDRFPIQQFEAFRQQACASRNEACLHMAEICDAQHHADHQPVGDLILPAILRPGQAQAADHGAVEKQGVGPAEIDFAFRRAMGGDGVAQRVHGGEMRAAGGRQRLVGLQHHRELHEIITPHPDQRARALSLRDGAGMGKGVAKLTQPHLREAGGKIEGRLIGDGHDGGEACLRIQVRVAGGCCIG